MLLKRRLKPPAFSSKRRSRSVSSMSPPRQRASTHRRCDNRDIAGNVLGGTVTSRL